jgi:hypothetical protein
MKNAKTALVPVLFYQQQKSAREFPEAPHYPCHEEDSHPRHQWPDRPASRKYLRQADGLTR